MDDPSGNWPKWLSGALNVVSGVAQGALGAALGATVGWTGIGAVAAGFLILNGAATATQGIGQIVNAVTQSSVMREDNIIRTGVQSIGRAIGGNVGATAAVMAYDTAVMVAAAYAPYASTPVANPPTKVVSTIENDIIDLPRTGSALKTDAHHAFPDIVDNYVGYATKTSINNGTLYQIEGSLNGVAGRFEWIVQDQFVTHRFFVEGGGINGIPIWP